MDTSQAIVWAAAGTGFIFGMTCLGSAVVFLFRGRMTGGVQRAFLGFAAGIMIAASVFGLLVPSIAEATAHGGSSGWIPAAGGFAAGALFLFALDRLIPHLHPATGTLEGPRSAHRRTTLLVSAVTLHNIPEGMAVGLSFALAAQHGADAGMYASAVALAAGIGIQNFPEGAAISLPLHGEGLGRGRAFLAGCASGAVEPLFGMAMVALAGVTAPVMPWLLAFAAGAMMYVVVEELIPEAHLGEHSHTGTLSVMAGFVVMMVLDVALS